MVDETVSYPLIRAVNCGIQVEQQHGVRVEVTVITSDVSLWQKISSHNMDYDVFAVNAAELQRYIA